MIGRRWVGCQLIGERQFMQIKQRLAPARSMTRATQRAGRLKERSAPTAQPDPRIPHPPEQISVLPMPGGFVTNEGSSEESPFSSEGFGADVKGFRKVK
jgi:hypothetical protein